MSAAARPGPRAAARPESRRCWLVKSNPGSYSIHDLQRDGTTHWDGVRNYQARNMLRDDMRPGDPVLYYHSGVEPMAIAGVAEVAGPARPDPTAFDPKDHHYDPDSDPASPTWYLVDLSHVRTFAAPVERAHLAADEALAGMMVLQRGSRLSVQPVTPAEYAAVLALADALASGRAATPTQAKAKKAKAKKAKAKKATAKKATNAKGKAKHAATRSTAEPPAKQASRPARRRR